MWIPHEVLFNYSTKTMSNAHRWGISPPPGRKTLLVGPWMWQSGVWYTPWCWVNKNIKFSSWLSLRWIVMDAICIRHSLPYLVQQQQLRLSRNSSIFKREYDTSAPISHAWVCVVFLYSWVTIWEEVDDDRRIPQFKSSVTRGLGRCSIAWVMRTINCSSRHRSREREK